MATHQDVVNGTARRLGIVRNDQAVPGALNTEFTEALEDMLLELNEEVSLDFDPTDATDVPGERRGHLRRLFMYYPVFDQYDTRRTPEAREALYSLYRRRFFGAVVGDSDWIEPEVRDF